MYGCHIQVCVLDPRYLPINTNYHKKLKKIIIKVKDNVDVRKEGTRQGRQQHRIYLETIINPIF